MIKKKGAPLVNARVIELAKHIHDEYPSASLIFEHAAAEELHQSLPFPVYATNEPEVLHSKTDFTTTLGGDGTILHASSLFATAESVPPILSFSMGTLGFLGEWRIDEYKRAVREIYTSGATVGAPQISTDTHPHLAANPASSAIEGDAEDISGWSSVRGKGMGASRTSKVLIRNRLKVGIYDPEGNRIDGCSVDPSTSSLSCLMQDIHAMNEVVIHRGASPHLAIIDIYVGGRFLTEAVADGMIISTPTGSTAYSLSSGGSIIHPLVSSLMLTPICPRSLSFRPLVLPANSPISLRLSEKNRGRELEVSIDGRRSALGVGCGMEIRVLGEAIKRENGLWEGGVPCIVRGRKGNEGEDDGWVGGLNGLLKFNYPFGDGAGE
jgi:NADH kinase